MVCEGVCRYQLHDAGWAVSGPAASGVGAHSTPQQATAPRARHASAFNKMVHEGELEEAPESSVGFAALAQQQQMIACLVLEQDVLRFQQVQLFHLGGHQCLQLQHLPAVMVLRHCCSMRGSALPTGPTRWLLLCC